MVARIPGLLRRRTSLDVAVAAGAGILLLAAAYLLINANFAYIYLTGTVCTAVAAYLLTRPSLRRTFVLISSLFLSLLAVEILLSVIEGPGAADERYTKGYSERIRINGGALGYAAAPSKSIHAWKIVGNDRVYDVTYTTDSHGFRVTPGFEPGASIGSTIAFFGCSFVFGEGLNDDETLPSHLAARLGFRHRIVNAGFSGYGPHQMLRLLELDRLEGVVDEPLRTAVYVALPSHAYRAAGRVWWDPVGPEYHLDREHLVRYVGAFTDVPENWVPAYYKLLQLIEVSRRSLFVDRFMRVFIDPRDNEARDASDAEDLAILHASIVQRTAQLLQKKYGAALHVLLWDNDTHLSELMLQQLAARDIPVIKVSDYIPLEEQAAFRIPRDGHPTSAANRVLAQALAERIGFD